MAEGFLRHFLGNKVEVASAGSQPNGQVHSLAIQVMKEVGIDISAHQSKSLNIFLNRDVHTVITVCGKTDQICPQFPKQTQRYHWGFEDPALIEAPLEKQIEGFRKIRDEIKNVFSAYAAGILFQFCQIKTRS